MGDTRQIEKYKLIKAEHPEMNDVEVCRQAGYSEKRLRATASELRRNSRVQAQIAAIRNKRLSAAPTKESYYALLNSAAEAALRESNSKSSWILLRCAELVGQELSAQPAKPQEQPRAVLVKFVDSPLAPEEIAVLNKSAATFENQVGMLPGTMGRLRSSEEAPPTEPPRPVEQKGKPAKKEEDRWLRCERHGKFWNVASCPSCDALKWQEEAYRAMAQAHPVVN